MALLGNRLTFGHYLSLLIIKLLFYQAYKITSLISSGGAYKGSDIAVKVIGLCLKLKPCR